MRASEFVTEAVNSASVNNLISTLENLRSQTNEIRLDSLINLVRKKPGSEMFNTSIFLDAYKENPAVKEMIRDVSDDTDGAKYVYLSDIVGDNDLPIDYDSDSDSSGMKNPQQTVSSMAKRAALKRA
jgi:hypothetical protein